MKLCKHLIKSNKIYNTSIIQESMYSQIRTHLSLHQIILFVAEMKRNCNNFPIQIFQHTRFSIHVHMKLFEGECCKWNGERRSVERQILSYHFFSPLLLWWDPWGDLFDLNEVGGRIRVFLLLEFSSWISFESSFTCQSTV